VYWLVRDARGSLSSAGPSASHGGNWLGVFLGLLEHHVFTAAAAQREFAVASRIGGPNYLYLGSAIRLVTFPKLTFLEIHNSSS